MEMCEEEGDHVEIKTEATETDDVTNELRDNLIYAVDKSCTVEKLPNEVLDGRNKLSRKAKTEAKNAIQEKLNNITYIKKMKEYEEKEREKKLNEAKAKKKKKENRKLADIRWHGMSKADKFAIVMEAMEDRVLPQYVAQKHGIHQEHVTSWMQKLKKQGYKRKGKCKKFTPSELKSYLKSGQMGEPAHNIQDPPSQFVPAHNSTTTHLSPQPPLPPLPPPQQPPLPPHETENNPTVSQSDGDMSNPMMMSLVKEVVKDHVSPRMVSKKYGIPRYKIIEWVHKSGHTLPKEYTRFIMSERKSQSNTAEKNGVAHEISRASIQGSLGHTATAMPSPFPSHIRPHILPHPPSFLPQPPHQPLPPPLNHPHHVPPPLPLMTVDPGLVRVEPSKKTLPASNLNVKINNPSDLFPIPPPLPSSSDLFPPSAPLPPTNHTTEHEPATSTRDITSPPPNSDPETPIFGKSLSLLEEVKRRRW